MLGQYLDKPVIGGSVDRPLLKKNRQASVVTGLNQWPFFRTRFDFDCYSHKSNLAPT